MKIFTISQKAALLIESLFPCPNTPRKGVVWARSNGSRRSPKILERMFRWEDDPELITLKVHFPGKQRPICFFMEEVGYIYDEQRDIFIKNEPSTIILDDRKNAFRLLLDGEPFWFPKDGYTEETIRSIETHCLTKIAFHEPNQNR